MKKSRLIGAFWAFYLGSMVTGLFGTGLTDIRWWLIVAPVIFLSTWEKNTYNKENKDS